MLNYTELEQLRKKHLKNALCFLLISVAIFIIAFIANGFYVEPFFIVFCTILGVIGFMANGQKYNNMVMQQIAPLVFTKMYGNDYKFSADSGIRYEKLANTGLFACPDEYYSSNLLQAKYHNIPFTISDVDFVYISYSTDSKGNTQKHEDHNHGRVLMFDLARTFDYPLAVIEKWSSNKIYQTKVSRNKIDLESIEFNKKFTTTCDDDHMAYYVLTPQLQLRIIEAEKQFNGKFAFFIIGNKAIICMGGTNAKFKSSLFTPVDESFIGRFEHDYTFPLTFIDTLALDSGKMNNDKLTEKIF